MIVLIKSEIFRPYVMAWFVNFFCDNDDSENYCVS